MIVTSRQSEQSPCHLHHSLSLTLTKAVSVGEMTGVKRACLHFGRLLQKSRHHLNVRQTGSIDLGLREKKFLLKNDRSSTGNRATYHCNFSIQALPLLGPHLSHQVHTPGVSSPLDVEVIFNTARLQDMLLKAFDLCPEVAQD